MSDWNSDVDSGYVYREGVRMGLEDPSDFSDRIEAADRRGMREAEAIVELLGNDTAAAIGHAMRHCRTGLFRDLRLMSAASRFERTAYYLSERQDNEG